MLQRLSGLMHRPRSLTRAPARSVQPAAGRARLLHSKPRIQPGAPTIASRALPDPLLSVSWLDENLEAVSVLDARYKDAAVVAATATCCKQPDYTQYLEGHIPHAVFIRWNAGGESARPALEHDQGEFAASVERLGVSHERPVVVYDGGSCLAASRVWWSLLVHGHPAPHVLAGGWQAWVAAARPSELYEPCPLKIYSNFEPEVFRAGFLAVPGELTQQLESGGRDVLVLHCTPHEGLEAPPHQTPATPETAAVQTLAAASRQLHLRDLWDDSASCWLPADTLQRKFADLGVEFGAGSNDQKVVLMSGEGLACCTAALLLAHLQHWHWCVVDESPLQS